MATRKMMTYGTLPTREEFDGAFVRACSWGIPRRALTYAFTNDPRVGTCELTAEEVWRELMEARGEWQGWIRATTGQAMTEDQADASGQWCSDVLGVLGFEWV